jgi:SAM-dependent methyltransferase
VDPDLIRAEAAAEGWWSRGRTEVIKALLPAARGDQRVLDIGSGWGAVTSKLGAWGTVIGVEPSEEAREEAERRGVTVLEGTAEHLPVEAGSADIAIASDVIEHLPDDIAAVREMTRVLRPGGVGLITVPANPWLMGAHDRALGHYRRYTEEGLLRVVQGAGLVPTRTTHFNTLLFPLAIPGRLIGRRRAARADNPRAPGWLDAVFYRVFRAEPAILSRFDLPFGLSLAVLATRPDEVGQT